MSANDLLLKQNPESNQKIEKGISLCNYSFGIRLLIEFPLICCVDQWLDSLNKIKIETNLAVDWFQFVEIKVTISSFDWWSMGTETVEDTPRNKYVFLYIKYKQQIKIFSYAK